MKTGVYTITNLINSKIYVGSATKDFKIRWRIHLSNLKLNRHHSKYLQYSFNKYGESNFKFEILEKCLPEFCLSTEQYWMNMLNVCNRNYGYNATPVAGNKSGFRFSEESKIKMSNSAKGNRKHMLGRIVKQETKDKLTLIVKKWHQDNKSAFLKNRESLYTPILKICISTNKITEYKSLIEAAQLNNLSKQNIRYKCSVNKNFNGFIWKTKK
jgi:group I intron endonuclease